MNVVDLIIVDLLHNRIELSSVEGCRSIVHIDAKFCVNASKQIQNCNDVVIKVVVPKPNADDKIMAAFFRKSRRKTFDLAILNAAFLAKVADNKIEKVEIVFGGSDQVLTNATIEGPSEAVNTIKTLTGLKHRDS